ncbi:hypothetical protein BCR42DRAFT_396904 [Absidia repens]|uniref:Uncharacterized protein n=1 Tax=Absidia repens TaxID=90262 RepID=A0A1X2I2S1_9FUNG|nr:hypothetical protein BCR42DRAFT_396904 [Absidia repens]
MNSTWALNQEEQLVYFKAMATQHFDIYEAHAFSERQHYWSKNATLNNYLVPTLLEYSHYMLSKPTNTLELLEYRRSRRQLVDEILQTPEIEDKSTQWSRNWQRPMIGSKSPVTLFKRRDM